MKPTLSHINRSALAFAALTLATLVPAEAQLAGQLGVLDLTANDGINPATGAAWAEGDTYRLLFLTSQTTDAISADITTYNSFVQGVAVGSTDIPKLGNGLWKILGSTLTVDARDNTGTNPDIETGVPIFLTDGTSLLASNNAELWSVPSAVPVTLDENGIATSNPGGRVFTGSFNNGTGVGAGGGGGSNGDGTGSGDTSLGVLDGQGVQTGSPYGTLVGRETEFWIRQWKEPAANFLPVYAISEPLTVVDSSDSTAPTLTSIEDDQSGGPVEVPEAIVYTVTFDKTMSAGSVDVSDFGNDPTLNTAVTIDSVSPTADPAVFEVTVSTAEAGSLQLQIKQDAALVDLPGNALDTSSALPDDVTITVGQDLVDPTLVSIGDDVGGGPIVATQSMTPQYSVTFSEAIDPATVGADDFENGSSASLTIDRVSPTGDPTVFEVVVTTSGPGDLVLQIKAGAEIKDLAGNDLDTSSALPDDTTITVNSAPGVTGELGVFDAVNANGGINPATGVAWAEGDTYRLAFVTSTTTTGTSTDITTYNAFVQGVADATPTLGGGTWKVIASTQTVAARDNTGTNPGADGVGVPIVLMDGVTLFASDNNDLWNGAEVPLNIDENGATSTAGLIFAGTFADGASEPVRFLGTTTPDPEAVVVQTGSATNTGPGWIRSWNAPVDSSNAVYALSEPLSVVSGAPGPQITSFTPIGGGVWELTILGDPDTGYEFRSSPTLDFNPGTLAEGLTPGIPAVGTIGGANDSELTTDSNGDGKARMTLTGDPADFVRSQIAPPPPPLLSESFDAAAVLPTGWMASAPSNGTEWQIGIPTGALTGPLAASSSPNCAATNISSDYTANTSVTLTSPSIAIPAGSGATLSFQQFVDTDLAGDIGSVRILDADNSDTPIVGLEITPIEGDGNNAEWSSQTLDLPAGDVGAKNIKVEFQFVSNAAAEYGGFYVDDVTVTVP